MLTTMAKAELRFSAPMQEASGGGRWVEIPADVAATFPEKRAPVCAVVNGHEYRSRISAYGGRSYLGLRAELRREAGIDVGDVLDIELTIDDQPRVVEEPSEFATALAGSPEARQRFDALSYTHRKEYARWVGEAKRQETRDRRAAKSVEMLLAGIRTPD
jgi:bifunctional DNA-binding transcriptional regulator/antitoxin component of YhaV-PrlF toxin-antitoxin module